MAGERILDPQELEELQASVTGTVIAPGQAGYDEARGVWNGMIDRRPAAVLRCESDDDVIAGLGFAREHELPIAVRGGGHSVAGKSTCDDGIVIDLSRINRVQVDADAREARVGGGALLRHVDEALQAHGLVVPAGVVSHTGVAGLTLGGGVGWLTRKHGLTCDNLISLRVVLADGTVVTASGDENQELFWALHGGGGNFGVVTEFHFRAHESARELPVAIGFWPLESAHEVIRVHRELMPDRPEEWKATVFVARATDAIPGMPPAMLGQPVMMILQVWATPDLDAARREFKPYVDAAPPLLQTLAPTPFVELQRKDDAVSGYGRAAYTKGGYLDEFSDGAIDALLEGARDLPNELSMIEVIAHGGRQLAVGEDDSAFSDRSSPYSFNVYSRWELDEDHDHHMAVARNSYRRIEQHANGGVYTNFFAVDDGHDQVIAAYGQAKYDRLATLKAQLDPDNVFALNGNILPAASQPAH